MFLNPPTPKFEAIKDQPSPSSKEREHQTVLYHGNEIASIFSTSFLDYANTGNKLNLLYIHILLGFLVCFIKTLLPLEAA